MLILELRFFQQASQGAPSQEWRPCWSSRRTATAQVKKKWRKRKKSYKEEKSVLLKKGKRSSRVTFLLLILAAKGKSFYYIYYYNKAYALQWQKMARVEREKKEKESEEKKLYYISYSIISLSLSDSFHTTPFQLLFDYAPPSQKDPRERKKRKITTRTCGEFKDFLKTKMRLPRTFGGETGGRH